MICADVGLYDSSCNLLDASYVASLFRGLGDGVTTPDFLYLATFVGGCVDDPCGT